MITIKASFPKLFDLNLALQVIGGDLNALAESIKKDFEATVATWTTKPRFEIVISRIPIGYYITVFTEDEIYGYISRGTKPHGIVPKNARWLRFPSVYFPKTDVGILGSKPGGHTGAIVYRKKVFHPGIEARGFEEAVAEKYGRELSQRARDAVRKALTTGGFT